MERSRGTDVNGLEVQALATARGGFRLGPVSFVTPRATASVVLGPSGSGKTTLLRTLAGFLPAAEGRVLLDGEEVTNRPAERRRFGFVPPGLGLFPHRRVEANVGYPLELAGISDWRARAREWLGRFDLTELAHRYPGQLSSGERQRVALARALAAGPRLLLWDEPLSALDVERRDELLLLLRAVLAEEAIPLVLVTHDPSTAFSLADRYLQVAHGSVLFEGTTEEYLARPTDPFHARFLGYENIWSRSELERSASEAPLARALLGLAGPGGVAVPARGLTLAFGPMPGSFPFRPERWQPNPERTIVWGRSGSLGVRVVAPGVPELRRHPEMLVELDASTARALDRTDGGR
ncbi:MAG TPA: ATP-binding cassette domain-containing protein [Thermoplasmata archaeon]|nr:ATP-binding cassette domain-containing protein [Thermoplasmata archaeon]